MSRFLVTGATGFLGRHLVDKLLAEGHGVVALCRDAAPDLERAGVEVRPGDILVKGAVKAAAKGCDGLFHLAGKVSRRREDAELLQAVHVTGTENALKEAKAAGLRRAVYVSTSGVVAVSEDPNHIAVEDDPTPLGVISRFPYYRTKFFAEEKAKELGTSLGVEVVIVSPTLLLGPGDVHGSSTGDVERIVLGQVPVVPSGGLSFVDVRDVADALLKAWDRGEHARRYFLGACNMTHRAFVGRVARVAGVAEPLLKVPRSAALAKALVGLAEVARRYTEGDDLLDPLVVDMARYYWYLDATRAETELGFRARDPLETIADTIEDIYPSPKRQSAPPPVAAKARKAASAPIKRPRQGRPPRKEPR
jgi:dihydroflavonol-4-reductase